MPDKKCQVCWQEVMDKILNEITIIGLDMDDTRRQVREIEKFLNEKWARIRKENDENS